MITIDVEQCTGCGACVEVCPAGALYLVIGKAMMDGTLCRDCEACLAACPTGAISLAAQEEPAAGAVNVPAIRPEPEVIRIKAQPAPAPSPSRVLPTVRAALAWAGREMLPRLAGFLRDALDRRTTGLQSRGTLSSDADRGSQQHRRRWRGGEG